MDAAHELAAGGAPHGAAVRAVRQDRGRGQHGRRWSAGEGGLWISVIGRPAEVVALPALAPRIGLAVAEALDDFLPADCRLQVKWPNDLILRGRKVCGILTEARWAGERCLWVVAGVGMNVTNSVPAELADRAAALGEFVSGLTAEALAGPVRRAAAAAMESARGLSPGEIERWNGRHVLAGREVASPLPGEVAGIAPDGALLIRDGGGRVHSWRGGVATAND